MEGQSTNENKGEEVKLKIPMGKSISFIRRGFTNVSEMNNGEILQDEFRKFYLEERKSGRTDIMQIFREYRKNLELYNRTWFNPYPHVVKGWIRKWEQSLPIHIRKIPIKGRDVVKHQRDEKKSLSNEVKQIEYKELEDGAKNLQSLLLEDANELVKESNADYEMIDPNGGFWDKDAYEKLRVKKKALALAISKEIIGGAQKHQLIRLKTNKEGRETVGFMMELFKSATAGELSEKDLELLDTSIPKA